MKATSYRFPHLADTLRAIARDEATSLYGGELGQQHRGRRAERTEVCLVLKTYRPTRQWCAHRFGHASESWDVATNPPPAVGGSCLAAMLLLLERLGTGNRPGRVGTAHGYCTACSSRLPGQPPRWCTSSPIRTQVETACLRWSISLIPPYSAHLLRATSRSVDSDGTGLRSHCLGRLRIRSNG